MGRLFMNRANRDRAWILGGRRGSRSSIRNQQLHPMYVEDYEQVTGHRLEAADKVLGNTIYRTSFGVLYRLESPRTW